MNMIELDMRLIDEDLDQPRYQFDEEALQELARSIEELGLLSPIKVRKTADGRYKIIYGNRRYKASQLLGRATIPCIVSDLTDEKEIYLEQIAENLTRDDFSPIEEAEAFNRMMTDARFGSSIKYVSSKLGKPEAYIKNKLELLSFSPAVRKLIVKGSEIRKDKLTEDQLLPLKDLPMEHRDSLALIMARDEMPVTDVKKIAKLFKDKDISDNTKNKLLLKNGYELLETWATFEHNRKERAKAAAAVPTNGSTGTPLNAASVISGDSIAVVTGDAPGNNTLTNAPSEAASGSMLTVEDSAVSGQAIAQTLKQLLATVAEPLPEHAATSVEQLTVHEADKLITNVDQLLGHLESQIKQWKEIRQAALSKFD